MEAAVHVLLFPGPAQGHINCMQHLATGLLGAGMHVTFLHTDDNLHRLGGGASATPTSPRLRLLSVPDGFPDDNARSAAGLVELMESWRTNTSVAYRSLLASLRRDVGDGFPPLTFVVADDILPFAIDVAEELGVPVAAFHTASACSFLAFMSVPRLVELGELPFPAGADLDEPVRGVPGMESFLRRRDLPSLCRHCPDIHNDRLLQMLVHGVVHAGKARALLLNTSPSLERTEVANIAPHMHDVFAVGPLHAMSPAPSVGSSLWREDDSCLAWLDGQADHSVVYVSLGSITVISQEQFTEFLAGLVGAGYPFLWVLRPDMVAASQSAALQEAIRAAGSSNACVVEWAPQRDVLRHRAVGCFLSHAGWNSTVEGVAEGVPMVCWPFFGDQQVNSRFVSAVWKTGMDMKDACDRATVERMVKEAMESAEIRGSALALSEKLRRDVADGGSSAMEFKRLVRSIKELSTPPDRNS